MGNKRFKRLQKELKRANNHVRFKRIRHGFYRIYWKNAYLGELYKDLPLIGHDIVDEDMSLEDKQYAIDKMEDGEIQRKIKNFVEGYIEVKNSILRRLYMLKHDKEFYDTVTKGYRQVRVT